jgi:hypothetical protein
MKRKRTPPVTAEQAVAEARAAGYEPGEPYPGKASALWKMRCVECGQPRTLRLTNIRQGRRCHHLRAPSPSEDEVRKELAEAGFELVDGWDGRAFTVLSLRCVECGQIKRRHLGDVRQGKLCGHRPPAAPVMDPLEAAEEMREYGYEPEEPYPGTVGAPWRCRCRNRWCRRERSVTLKAARMGRRCGHQRGAKPGKPAANPGQKGHGIGQTHSP